MAEELRQAFAAHQAGEFERAERLYRQWLRQHPDDPQAVYLLGTLQWQQGQHGSAAVLLRRAVGLQPTLAEAWINLGLASTELGKWDDAEAQFRHALDLRPNDADAWFHLANLLRERGRDPQAFEAYEKVLAGQPDHAGAWHNLALLQRRAGAFEDALRSVERALDHEPASPAAHNLRGAILHSLGRSEEAEGAFRQAIALAPAFAEAWSNLGNVLGTQGRLEEALAACRQSVAMAPNRAAGWLTLGNILQLSNKKEEAVAAFTSAVAAAPHLAAGHAARARALVEVGRLHDACAAFENACQRDPNQPNDHAMLACLYEQLGRFADAVRVLTHAANVAPAPHWFELRRDLVCPTVFESNAAIDAYRERLAASIARAIDAGIVARPTELLQWGIAPPFNLPFHGRNDLPLKRALAQLLARSLPAGATPKTSEPRVGFVVTAGHERAFLRSIGGMFRRFTCREIRPMIFCAASAVTELRERVADDRVAWVPLPAEWESLVHTIRSAQCRVLYYWEVGNSSVNYFLPFLRLAPVQCTSWGIQVTTGIAAVDVYLSSRWFEPADADAHYTETLVRLETLLSYQPRPQTPVQPLGRDNFGFSDRDRVYLCPQHLGKIHPDFDEALGRILDGDGRGVVVLIAAPQAEVTHALEQRLRRTLPEVCDRIRFVPPQRGNAYASLLLAADVLLDPFPFGGVNTTYDTFALGKVTITLPGAYQRGRFTYGCYRAMGWEGASTTTVDAYVSGAIALANDPDRRHAYEREIAQRRELLFENAAAARELEAWLAGAAAMGHAGNLEPTASN